MEPTAPPYYSLQNSPNIHGNSVDITHSKEGHCVKHVQSIPTSSANLSFKCNNEQSLYSGNKNHKSKDGFSEGTQLKSRFNDLCKNKHQPYVNCQKQLSMMESSLDTPSYENVARFHEQQRQIAEELESNRGFSGKSTKTNSVSEGVCQYCRINRSNVSVAGDQNSVLNISKPQKHCNSLNTKMVSDDSPPPFSSLHEKSNGEDSKASGWCQFSTRSFCRNIDQSTTLQEERSSNESKENTVSPYAYKNPESSSVLCNEESTKYSNNRKKKWLQRINLLASISTMVILIMLIISEVYPIFRNGESKPENTTSVTYTNVHITPCGNYFWHSAGTSGSTWLPRDVAIKNDQSLIENTFSTGIDWGYNGILELPSWYKSNSSKLNSRSMKSSLEEFKRYRLRNALGYEVDVLSLGATITSIKTPDKRNNIDDIILGFDNLADYLGSPKVHLFGSTIGRVSSRIVNGTFSIDDEMYILEKNDGNDHFDGTYTEGFHLINWKTTISNNSVVFSMHSKDVDSGYPGHLNIAAAISLSPISGELKIEYSGMSTEKTPIDVSNNILFNLAGHKTGKAGLYDHFVQINADKYIHQDPEMKAKSTIVPVAKTPFDMRISKHLGRAIFKLPKEGKASITQPTGFDETYVISRNNRHGIFTKHFAARVEHRKSGRFVEVYSNQPGLHFYTGNSLPNWTQEAITGKDGSIYEQHGGFSMRSQMFPNALNTPSYGLKTILNPGEMYYNEIIFKFGTFIPNRRNKQDDKEQE